MSALHAENWDNPSTKASTNWPRILATRRKVRPHLHSQRTRGRKCFYFRESVFYGVLEEVCDKNSFKTECYAVVDDFEEEIKDWFLEGRLRGESFDDAICNLYLSACGAAAEEPGSNENESEGGSESETVSEDETTSQRQPITVQSLLSILQHRLIDPLKRQSQAAISLTQRHLTPLLKRAEERLNNLLASSQGMDRMRQAEKSLLTRLDEWIAYLRILWTEFSARSQQYGLSATNHARLLARQTNLKLTGNPELPPWLDQAFDLTIKHWHYLFLFAMFLLLLLPLLLFKRLCCCWCGSDAQCKHKPSAAKSSSTLKVKHPTSASKKSAKFS